MGERKRKSSDHGKKGKKKFGGKGIAKANGKQRTGPHLPNAMRKELDLINPKNSDSDEEINSDIGGDVYEYEEELAEEESKKNRRFDPVDNYEYELPEKFKDEIVPSDDDEDEEAEEEDEERHARMLQGITGMPIDALVGNKRKNHVLITELYPESPYNPSRDVLDGGGLISVDDLLNPIQGKFGHSKLKKRMREVEKKSTSIVAPLPKPDQERLLRKAGYGISKQDITKWEPLIKKNREAPTVFFNEDVDVGYSTVGAIASEFEPRTEFEKKMASLVSDAKVVEAHNTDGSKLLELNKISPEDYMKERDHIAKMRNLLFNHEMKKKRIKKIKSKTYHRLMKREKLKAAAELMDPETAKEQAEKQEFKRAEERLTLKHKNKSKWARRILDRGLSVQDEGTRAAVAEQLNQHALLTRKMNSMKDGSSSSDSSSDEDDDDLDGSDRDRKSKLLAKAREKTLKVLEEEEEAPKSGVFALPFMVRGMEKRKQEAIDDATHALQDYEQLDDADGKVNSKPGTVSGRMVFGGAKSGAPKSNNKKTDNDEMKIDNYYGNEDSEDDLGANKDFNVNVGTRSDAKIVDGDFANGNTENHQHSVFKNFEDIVGDPGPKTTYDVSIFASNTWKKMKGEDKVNTDIKRSFKESEPVRHEENLEKEAEEEGDSDSEGQMVDGILSSGPKESYELPSQAELIRNAFAGDDVEDEFAKDKEEVLNEENPEPEKPLFLPGWGQWTHVQKKKGLPAWMVKEQNDAKRKREEALKRRKDANLKHVIISEKMDKKTEKLQTKSVPYPYTSKEVFEQSMRMPIGPEYNPVSTVGALNRPEVVKRAGVIIKPIQFEEVKVHAKTENHGRSGQKRNAGGKSKKR